MPSSQWRFPISPSHAAQQSSVEGSGLAFWIAPRVRPMRTPRSSRIFQCGRPPPCAWSAITSSLQASMMRMRVSQSLQLAATLSFSTEFRCRVFRRCCRANVRARPLVIGSWNQRQRLAKSSTTLSIRATTFIEIPDNVRNYCAGSCEFESNPLIPFPFGADTHNLQTADLGRVRNMRAAAGLQVDAGNLEQPHATLAARRGDGHRPNELRAPVELGVRDPHRARRGATAHERVHLRLDRVLQQALHLDVEVEVRLVLGDAAAGDRRLHHRAEEMQRRVQSHQAMAALPVELHVDFGASGRIRAGLEHVEHLVRAGALARIDDAPWADAPD